MNTYLAIGLMSGTSLDGLDLIYCQFEWRNNNWQYKILNTKSIEYTTDWKTRLKNAFDLSDKELKVLDEKYGRWLGEQTKTFIDQDGLEVDLVASHGHTVFHQPKKGITVQIGSGQQIVNATGTTVVCDFRKQDVSLGGQGAPLVPIGDKYLFDRYIACINLGGIANISFDYKGERVAFDIGMANMLLNYLSNQVGHPFDKGGQLASRGKVDNGLLEALNNLEYYKLPYPKSTGYEWFISDVKPIIDKISLSIEDKMATAVEHEAEQIGKVLEKYLSKAGEVLITGGGAYNDFLIDRIKHFTPNHLSIIVPDKPIIEFKEALIFAFMGVLRNRNEVNCLKTVTGAIRDSSGGDIFNPVC
ncbi:MAG: anhydro-N-acetylmuramic acid kinase [Bacteroidota bacterium]